MGYYIQTRYPEAIKTAGPAITQELAQKVLVNAEQMVKWVLSMLQ